MTRPVPARQSRVAAVTTAASWGLLAGCVALIGWLCWLVEYGYKAELARCGSVPDQSYPEIIWFFLLYPTGFAALLSVAGILWARRMKRWTWILLVPGLLIVVCVVWLVAPGTIDC